MADTAGQFDPRATARRLPVKPGEKPWLTAEVRAVHAELNSDLTRLQGELAEASADLEDLLNDPGGAGDDQADTGSRALEREQALTMVNTLRDMVLHTELAIARMVAGTFGVCDSCGEPIGKARVQAFPRAVLCVACKQREERR
ncbi:MAG: TraR/DksA family transcriptional regulator [Bifidobacteriaceae bacterium]|nr:TraR/DksA family transcriptional regulator [Bifidobacteriaceae bacterium]